MRRLLLTCLIALIGAAAPAAADPAHIVHSLKITTLSTMLADRGIGEWGYSALVEVDGREILFDTGKHPDAVLRNAKDLGIDLSTVDTLILSHNHGDHTGGLLALREAMAAASSKNRGRSRSRRACGSPGRCRARTPRPTGSPASSATPPPVPSPIRYPRTPR